MAYRHRRRHSVSRRWYSWSTSVRVGNAERRAGDPRAALARDVGPGPHFDATRRAEHRVFSRWEGALLVDRPSAAERRRDHDVEARKWKVDVARDRAVLGTVYGLGPVLHAGRQ